MQGLNLSQPGLKHDTEWFKTAVRNHSVSRRRPVSGRLRPCISTSSPR